MELLFAELAELKRNKKFILIFLYFNYKMRVITLEELEQEKVKVSDVNKVYCYDSRCKHRGDYVRCYFDTCVLCPIYDAHYKMMTSEQQKLFLHNI